MEDNLFTTREPACRDILLVEDTLKLAQLIEIFLKQEGYSIIHAPGGEAAMKYLKEYTVKLMILDLTLPGMDGFAVCRAVREQWNLPIIIISARSDRSDKLNCYELGADDYVEKPVDVEILTAKVRALLQRAYRISSDTQVIESGGIVVHQESRKVYVDGVLIDLNVKEYELLLLFISNPEKTLHKDYIFNKIWGMDSSSENQTLTVHIKRIRSKLEQDPRSPKRILTVWGIGYRYEEI